MAHVGVNAWCGAIADETVPTGEEEEETVYATRVKLYIMQSDGGWRERGVGALKLNVRRSDGLGARLGERNGNGTDIEVSPGYLVTACADIVSVMRAEGVLRLVLNVSLYVGMTCLEDGKHVRMTVFEDNERRLITLRVGLSVFPFLSLDSIRQLTIGPRVGGCSIATGGMPGVSNLELTLHSSDWVAESRVRAVRPYSRPHPPGIGTA